MFPCHGQCAVWLKLLHSSTVSRHFVGKRSRRSTRRLRCAAAVAAGVVILFPEVGRVLVGVVCFACSLRFAALFACLVCCFVLAFACLCPCWASLPCYNWHPVLVRVWPAEGTTLPLGLGGLNNLFLLVGLGLFILSRNTVSNPFAGLNRFSGIRSSLGPQNGPLQVQNLPMETLTPSMEGPMVRVNI